MYTRIANISKTNSFFLFGARGTGKSTLIKNILPTEKRFEIDLLDMTMTRQLTRTPSRLLEIVRSLPKEIEWVFIDEVQKIPELLDLVHKLIEETKINFALTGSSARKLKRGGGNLLGGRARRYELSGLVSEEIGEDFNLDRLLNFGNIPSHYLSNEPILDLESYVGDYIKEEIYQESLVRNLPRFIDFLRIAAITDSEIVDYTNIGSECGATSATVKNYYSILEDTLLGFYLPAYTKKQKRRIITSPKFYFTNVGVVNHLAKRRGLEQGGTLYGKAFENWIINEVRTYSLYHKKFWELSYLRTSSGIEVDLVINDLEYVIEFKSSKKVTDNSLKNLRKISQDNPQIKRRILVSLDTQPQKTNDGIELLPLKHFLKMLWGGEF